MLHSSDFRYFSDSLEKQEEAISRLAFCYDVYLNYCEEGKEPNEYMDAVKATEQLLAAVCDVIGLKR